MSTPPPAGEQLVCVTGASGYLASHVVRELLARGYRVRGTVRDPADPEKTDHLKRLPGAGERLELVRAELGEPEGLQRALRHCTALLHTASPASTLRGGSRPASYPTGCLMVPPSSPRE